MQRKMKSIVCLIAAVFMCFLSSCAKNSTIVNPPPLTDINWLGQSLTRTISMPLSFQNIDGKRLVVEMRDVEIESGKSVVEATVEELIKGPTNPQMRAVLPGVHLKSIEVSGEVANIEFSSEYEQLFPVEMLTARAAIANTLTAVSDIKYVNIYSDGREPGYGRKPLGAMEHLIGDLNLYQDQTRQELELAFISQEDLTEKRLATFYFADPSDEYLLAEVRQVEFLNADYINTLLNELTAGPRTEGNLPVLEGIMLLEEPMVSIVASGKSTITINLSQYPKNESLAYGSIVHTITGFVPEVQYVIIKVKGEMVVEVANAGEFIDGLMRSEHFTSLIGNRVALYFSNEKQTNLFTVQRTMHQKSVDIPRALLEALIKGPIASDSRQLKNAFPKDVTVDDILSVGLSNNTAIVNMKNAFAQKCMGIHENDEYLMIYSIVNTMTVINGIKQVQFLVEGKTVESLGGKIYLARPLMRNTGIIAPQ